MSTVPDSLAPGFRPAFGWSITIAILIILAGCLAIVLPLVSGIAITLIIGWFFTMAGVLHFLFAWKTHSTRGVFWEFLLGFLYLFAGLYSIFRPLAGLASLTLLLIGYFFFKGAMQIIHFFQLQPRHGSWWLLFDGIINLFLAILIWRAWPFSAVWVIGTLVGISLIFTGFSRLMLTLTARRVLTA
jgi:uncharacterized membrane protein HdeD (DUF308 family)